MEDDVVWVKDLSLSYKNTEKRTGHEGLDMNFLK